jgi:hypothetical protein
VEGESDKNDGVTEADAGESCTSCHEYFDKTDECDGNYVPLTKDEEWILSQMRAVKAKVVSVKKRLQELESLNEFSPLSPDEVMASGTEEQVQWLEQKQQLDTLRQEWQELNRRRQEAARLRMKILGHED